MIGGDVHMDNSKEIVKDILLSNITDDFEFDTYYKRFIHSTNDTYIGNEIWV